MRQTKACLNAAGSHLVETEKFMLCRGEKKDYSRPAAAKLLQSCPTLCDPRDGSPPGSPVPGILQSRTLEWVAISFSNAWKWKVKVKSLSRVQLLATPWTAAYQAPPSMVFARQEYWSGVPLPSPTLGLDPCKDQKKKKKMEEIYNPELTWTKEVTNLEEPEGLSGKNSRNDYRTQKHIALNPK